MRKPEEIRADYVRACAETGDLAFRIKRLNSDLDRAYVRLRSLDEEYAAVTRTPAEDLVENPQETKSP